MEVTLEAREESVVQSAGEFAREMVAPHAAQWEAQRQVPLDTIRAAADAGLAGLLVPSEHGGGGLSYTAMARVMEELAAECMAFAFSMVVHNNLADNIARNGTPGQIERFLPGMIRGETIGAFCLTEPGVGSDAAAVTTEARASGDEWIINGRKAWITNGAVANLFSIYAQTDPALGWKGIACILATDDTPGLVREAPYDLLGGHALGTNGITLENCRVPISQLLIGPGDAFKAAMRGISVARANVAAMCSGMMRASLGHALEYVARREVFGKPVGAYQGVQWQLADVATNLEAARLLTYRATTAIDRGEDANVHAAHAKKFATRAALSGISDCMQAMGAVGLRTEHPLARHMACAKIAQYLDGTTEIQNVVISRALFSGHGL